MTEIPKGEGSKYPTLMRNFETDEDLDEYVIDHAYMFVVIQIRPGGFVNGYGSNYTRTEVHVEEFGGDNRAALARAIEVAEGIYAETKKSLLVYAVANFAGALGFNRPVRTIPVKTFRSKADQRRDEARARKLRQEEKARKKLSEDKPVKAKKPKAAVFDTDFGDNKEFVKEAAKQTFGRITDEEFAATDVPMARLIRD
jgi:hypothetical protein